MAWSVTLTELITELRNRGGYRRSTALTDAILTSFLNYGIAETHDLIVKHNPDFLVTSTDLTTTADVATVALPSTFYKLRRLDLVSGSTSRRLRSFDIDEETYLADAAAWGSSSGVPRPRYMLQAGNLRFVPVPTAVYTIRCWYLPHATKLVSGSDSYGGVNGHEDLVLEHALKRCRKRDRQDTSDIDLEIQRLERRLLFALEARDQSEPEYLPDLGRGEWAFE